MTSSIVASGSRYDARTIVVGGIQLGITTAVGVVVFALTSRALTGTTEAIVQSLIVLVGGAVVTYWPAAIVRPREVDTIGWTTLLAYTGTVVFTILDIALLRPLGMYHWTWDAIGGGSGFWYISIWWMGGTFLAWMGAWAYAIQARVGAPSVFRMAGRTVGMALALYIVVNVLRGRPEPGFAALAYVVMAVILVPIAAFTGARR